MTAEVDYENFYVSVETISLLTQAEINEIKKELSNLNNLITESRIHNIELYGEDSPEGDIYIEEIEYCVWETVNQILYDNNNGFDVDVHVYSRIERVHNKFNESCYLHV